MENIEVTETVVVIVGAGPSGLAISACLTKKSIPHIILEKDDCCAPLWKKHTYDRLHLHLAKNYCSLPFKPHSPSSPTYMSKNEFVRYIDDYVAHFDIRPRYCRLVVHVVYDEAQKKWEILVKNFISNDYETYSSKFLVIASGENGKGFIPNIEGLVNFQGRVIHSNEYKSGMEFGNQNVLVVGCGNSGMEIAFDLSNYGANTSIVVKSPFHVVPREVIRIGMFLLKYLPMKVVDTLVKFAAYLKFGDLTKFGIQRPKEGPFFIKATKERSPVIDVGTVAKIKSRDIKVLPAISCIKEDTVVFENGEEHSFDAIVFATGFRSMACEWLKDYSFVLNENGMPKNGYPMHWKGEKGIYCVGLSRMGIYGVSFDAQRIANDIANVWQNQLNKAVNSSILY